MDGCLPHEYLMPYVVAVVAAVVVYQHMTSLLADCLSGLVSAAKRPSSAVHYVLLSGISNDIVWEGAMRVRGGGQRCINYFSIR